MFGGLGGFGIWGLVFRDVGGCGGCGSMVQGFTGGWRFRVQCLRV